MSFKIFTLLAAFAFTSCQLSVDKEKQANSQPLDTPKLTVATPQSDLPDSMSGSFVATLKDNIEQTDVVINDSVIFKVRKGQLFVYESYSGNAWIADGRSAYIPPEQVVKIDTPCFKFNFSKWDFVKGEDYELTQAARRIGVKLNSLIKRVRSRNTNALRTFFDLRNNVDGAAGEEYYYDFWALINVWTDTELASFAKSLSEADKKEFASVLIDDAPLTDATSYYQLYYPKTLKALKAAQ